MSSVLQLEWVDSSVNSIGLLIRNNRDVVVTLPMGSLIHPDMGTYLVLPARQTPLYRALHDAVNGGPAQTHQSANR